MAGWPDDLRDDPIPLVPHLRRQDHRALGQPRRPRDGQAARLDPADPGLPAQDGASQAARQASLTFAVVLALFEQAPSTAAPVPSSGPCGPPPRFKELRRPARRRAQVPDARPRPGRCTKAGSPPTRVHNDFSVTGPTATATSRQAHITEMRALPGTSARVPQAGRGWASWFLSVGHVWARVRRLCVQLALLAVARYT